LLALDGVGSLQGWQWLFLAQGLPAVLAGLMVLWLLPRVPEKARWLTEPERQWIQRELARHATQFAAPARHDVLALLGNPFVLLLGLVGLLGNAAAIGVILTAPTVLCIRAGLDTQAIGHLVSGGGVLGVVVILFVGWNSDRHGDRLRDAAACASIMMIGLFLLAVASTPLLVMTGYLLLVGSGFAGGVMQVAAWADVLHPRQLAVSGAAINTLWQIGSFVSPYAFGLARDATGSYTWSLAGSAVLAGVQVALILYVRARVRVSQQGSARLLGSSGKCVGV
jgi:ACS family tartrate transporter-like MFS transporter